MKFSWEDKRIDYKGYNMVIVTAWITLLTGLLLAYNVTEYGWIMVIISIIVLFTVD